MSCTPVQEALVKQRILQTVKELHSEGMEYNEIFRLLLGQVNDWWFHLYGLVGWWLT